VGIDGFLLFQKLQIRTWNSYFGFKGPYANLSSKSHNCAGMREFACLVSRPPSPRQTIGIQQQVVDFQSY
jgi:hypothetical protein